MPFNSALSGLQAASDDLRVLGNNIANASTVGFKKSRTDFSDVYAAGALGASSNAIGTGVKLASVSQQFTQGTINSADSNLDLAINGSGFFILNDSGSIVYSRAGAFGVDKDGFIANSERQQLTGFVTDENGNITGATGALQISTNNLSPKKTDNISITLNLDASATPPTVPFVPGFTTNNPPASTTFNNSTSTKIFDSLGNEHLLTTYFVKAHAENTWRVYVGIDGIDVTPTPEAVPAGPPFPALYPSGDASRLAAPFTMVFDQVGAYKPTDSANPPQYYGPTPITSNDAGLVDISGGIPTIFTALDINDLILNGIPIDPVTVADPFSTQAAFGSARSIVTSINAKSTLHGVTATNNPAGNQFELTGGTFGGVALAAGEFVINGVNITGAAPDRATLIGLINGQTPNTGVRAENGTGATDIRLVADDNRNIHIQTDGTHGTVDFTNFSITGGAESFVHRGSIQLSTQNNEGITVSGNNPSKADFSNGPLAGIIQTSSDPIEILQWDPNTGAETHARIVLDLSTSTQFSAAFSINSLDQDGYATGRLTGVDVDTTGIITARYGNGQSLQLGQVALASFSNSQGLQPLGDTTWSETFSSGTALLGAPGTSNLGLIQSGFLEDSNTQLTDELVSLIVAQRNFQASAQTIRTADAVTQTIINIR